MRMALVFLRQKNMNFYLRINNQPYKQNNGRPSRANHNVFDALDPQDGFLPAFSANRLMGVDLGLYRCGCWLAHGLGLSDLI